MSQFIMATHALVYLAHTGTRCSSQQLATNICANPAQIRKVTRALVAANLLEVQNGRDGGYALAKPAAQISLADVARACDTEFLAGTWISGDHNKPCFISSNMSTWAQGEKDKLEQELLESLSHKSIAQIVGELHEIQAVKEATHEAE